MAKIEFSELTIQGREVRCFGYNAVPVLSHLRGSTDPRPIVTREERRLGYLDMSGSE